MQYRLSITVEYANRLKTPVKSTIMNTISATPANTASATEVMQLVSERNNGNKVSENKLRDMLRTPMLGVCLHICPSLRDAERIFAEGMKRVFGNLGKFDGTQSFGDWCRNHFVNTAIEYVLYMAEEITAPAHTGSLPQAA